MMIFNRKKLIHFDAFSSPAIKLSLASSMYESVLKTFESNDDREKSTSLSSIFLSFTVLLERGVNESEYSCLKL